MINNLPTIFEVLIGSSYKLPKEKTPNSLSRSLKSSSKSQPQTESPPQKYFQSGHEEEDEDEDGERESTLCGVCGGKYANDEFWICCDVCERWFHGRCVKITPAKAEHIKQYKCPACSNKRARA